MFADTPFWDAPNTDLGNAADAHEQRYAGDNAYRLGQVETAWLNAIRNRAITSNDACLNQATDAMLTMLCSPSSHSTDFVNTFMSLYTSAMYQAYPLHQKIISERHEFLKVADDYTLQCIDMGLLRAIEDEAVNDASMSTFVRDMLKKLKTPGKQGRHQAYRQVFDIYSEAAVCHLLRKRCADKLEIAKIPETKEAGPDFECKLTVTMNGEDKVLHFYIEVKALDIVAAAQRVPEMLDDSMDMKIDLEEQQATGERIAIATGEIAPHKPFSESATYDSRSVRQVIETVIDKCANNFKNKQFQRGPTFALANLLRLPLIGQGASTLAPFFYDDMYGGACVSGVLWNVAFGEVGALIHRSPEFEGKGTVDGKLKRDGLLVDANLALAAAGLIAFHWDRGAYYFDGLYDAHWVNSDYDWSNLEVEAVMHALCGDHNDKMNSQAYEYARYRHRDRPS